MATSAATAARRRTRAEAKAETRRRVLEAARETFVREGFHAATLEAIAARAGYTKGAVYSGFGGKADLFLAVFEERTERRVAEMLAFEPADFEEGVAHAAAEWARVLRAEGEWTTALIEFRAFAARDAELRERFAALHARVLAATAESIARVAPRGAGGLSPAQLALAAVALGNGFALEAIGPGPAGVADEYLTVAHGLFGGLRAHDREE